jgi:hypothetical protein
LAKDAKFKKSVLDELEKISKEHDLLPFIRDYIGGLSVVHQTLRDGLGADVANWEKLILGSIEWLHQSFPGQVATGETTFAMSADEEVWLSKEYTDARRALEMKNRNLGNAAVRYVTSSTDRE